MPHSQEPDDFQPQPQSQSQAQAQTLQLPLLTLWYRFMFFDWMFRDMNTVRNLYERNAAAQHNRHMRRYLPTYLRRWSWLTLAGFALGCVFEHAAQASIVSAWFFTWSCITMTGMVIISVAWACLAHSGAR